MLTPSKKRYSSDFRSNPTQNIYGKYLDMCGGILQQKCYPEAVSELIVPIQVTQELEMMEAVGHQSELVNK